MLNISCGMLNTALKVKYMTIRMTIWVQDSCQRMGHSLSWSCGWLGAEAYCHCPASQSHCTASRYLRKGSKFKIWSMVSTECTYCFCTIVKQKNCKSNHSSQGSSIFVKQKILSFLWVNSLPLWCVVCDWRFVSFTNVFLILTITRQASIFSSGLYLNILSIWFYFDAKC